MVRKTGSFLKNKKKKKKVFTGDITTNTMLPQLEASSMAESQAKFVANPKGKAPTWELFRFRCKDGQVDSTKAYCTECKASVKLGGGTSNMSAHLRRHQPLLLNKPFGKAKVTSVPNQPGPAPIDSTGAGPSASTDTDVDPLTNLKTFDAAPKHKKQMMLGEALKKKETYPPNSKRASDINEKIGRFIVRIFNLSKSSRVSRSKKFYVSWTQSTMSKKYEMNFIFPSRRWFVSTAGDILTDKRAALKSRHVDRIIFLRRNMKWIHFSLKKMIWFPCLALVSEKYKVLFPFCWFFFWVSVFLFFFLFWVFFCCCSPLPLPPS